MGRSIILVANLAPRMMRGLESQGMLLAASNANRSRVIVLPPESDIEPGVEARFGGLGRSGHRGDHRRGGKGVEAVRAYAAVRGDFA